MTLGRGGSAALAIGAHHSRKQGPAMKAEHRGAFALRLWHVEAGNNEQSVIMVSREFSQRYLQILAVIDAEYRGYQTRIRLRLDLAAMSASWSPLHLLMRKTARRKRNMNFKNAAGSEPKIGFGANGGVNVHNDGDTTTTAGYENHYNTKLNKCFMKLSTLVHKKGEDATFSSV
jgi:hypothetical protein